MAYLGIDIGGTFAKLAIVSRNGKVLSRDRVDTQAAKGAQSLFATIATRLPTLVGRRKLVAAGVACAGLVDVRSGRVLASPNLPAFRNAPIRRIGRRALGVQTVIDNDANAAAYGEYCLGGGRRSKMLVCITLGTGIGGGIVSSGRVLRGSSGFAAEIGHMAVSQKGPKCRCGNRGCLEAYVGTYALIRDTKRRLRKQGSRFLQRHMDAGEPLTPHLIGRAAREGDRVANAVFADAAHHLGVAVASLVNLLNPDIVTLGGGVSAQFGLLAPAIRRTVRDRAFAPSAAVVQIQRAVLGDDAAPVGAAMMARDELEKGTRP